VAVGVVDAGGACLRRVARRAGTGRRLCCHSILSSAQCPSQPGLARAQVESPGGVARWSCTGRRTGERGERLADRQALAHRRRCYRRGAPASAARLWGMAADIGTGHCRRWLCPHYFSCLRCCFRFLLLSTARPKRALLRAPPGAPMLPPKKAPMPPMKPPRW